MIDSGASASAAPIGSTPGVASISELITREASRHWTLQQADINNAYVHVSAERREHYEREARQAQERIRQARIRYRWVILIYQAGRVERLADIQRAITAYLSGRRLRLEGFRRLSWWGTQFRRLWNNRSENFQKLFSAIEAVNDLLELLQRLCTSPIIPAAATGAVLATVFHHYSDNLQIEESPEIVPDAPGPAPNAGYLQ